MPNSAEDMGMGYGLQRLIPFFLALVSFGSLAVEPGVIGVGIGFKVHCSPLLGKADPREQFGPRYLLKNDPSERGKVKLAEQSRLKVISYNVLNLEESKGKWTKIDGKRVFQYGKITKPQHQIDAILRNIRAEKPDLMIGLEIESLNAMERVLGGEYFKILVPGNDDRINIGFLVHRRFAVDIEVQSHRQMKHLYQGEQKAVFSRDFPLLIFRDAGAPEGADPFLILGGVHLKSQRGGEEVADVGYALKRKEQIRVMMEILRGKFGDRTPIYVAGDFNANLGTAAEFQGLRDAGYQDAFQIMGVPENQRHTHVYFPPEGAPLIRQQLDGFFASPAGAGKIIEAKVMADLGPDGKPLPPVQTYEDRQTSRGSDHRGVSVTLDLTK